MESSFIPAKKELIDIGDMLENAWNLYRVRFKTFLAIMGLQMGGVIALLVLLVGIPLLLLFARAGFNLSKLSLSANPSTIIIFAVPITLAVTLILVLVYVSRVALLFAISDEVGGNLAQYFGRGLSLFLSYAWITFLIGIVVMLGFILMIIPGIIFWIWFAFAEFVLIKENLKGTQALSRSRELVRGRFFDVLIRIIIIVALASAINIVASAILSLARLSGLSSLLSSLFLTPYVTTAYYFLYRSLVETRSSAIVQ